MNTNVITNYAKLKPSLFFLPLFLLLTLVLVLYSQGSLTADHYIQIQKGSFFFINHQLGQYPTIEYNLTQLGDASISLSLLAIFFLYIPKMWEALLSASLISCLFSMVLKNIFVVPRPSEVFDNHSFIIVGETAFGFASLPSGHSITIFTTLTVLLFAFMPNRISNKILWVFSLIVTGLFIAFTRVGVGAHYPLDVIIGSMIGYISGLAGIFISRIYKIWTWINHKKYYPIFIVLILISGISLIDRILKENLIVFYFALFSLTVSLKKIINAYSKK